MLSAGFNLIKKYSVKRFYIGLRGMLPRPLKLMLVLRQSYQKIGWQAGMEAIARDLFQKTQLLGDFISAYYKGTYRDIEPLKMAMIIAAFGYFVSPVDLIPDTLLMIGLIDDIAIMTWLLTHLNEELIRFEAWQTGATEAKTSP